MTPPLGAQQGGRQGGQAPPSLIKGGGHAPPLRKSTLFCNLAIHEFWLTEYPVGKVSFLLFEYNTHFSCPPP